MSDIQFFPESWLNKNGKRKAKTRRAPRESGPMKMWVRCVALLVAGVFALFTALGVWNVASDPTAVEVYVALYVSVGMFALSATAFHLRDDVSRGVRLRFLGLLVGLGLFVAFSVAGVAKEPLRVESYIVLWTMAALACVGMFAFLTREDAQRWRRVASLAAALLIGLFSFVFVWGAAVAQPLGVLGVPLGALGLALVLVQRNIKRRLIAGFVWVALAFVLTAFAPLGLAVFLLTAPAAFLLDATFGFPGLAVVDRHVNPVQVAKEEQKQKRVRKGGKGAKKASRGRTSSGSSSSAKSSRRGRGGRK